MGKCCRCNGGGYVIEDDIQGKHCPVCTKNKTKEMMEEDLWQHRRNMMYNDLLKVTIALFVAVVIAMILMYI